jgi:molybdopterin-guanine dinucleotide biosynthesis protein A
VIRHPHVTAAILAGGRATRLGGALKALLPLTCPDDTPLARVLEVAQDRFARSLVIASDPAPFEAYDVTVVPDRVIGAGPLGGIEAALAAARTPLVLVLGGDMPSVSGDLVDWLVAHAREDRPLVPWRGGRPEPLHAIYPVSCLPLVRAALDDGVRKMSDFFARAGVDAVDETLYGSVPGADRSFDNINTPGDLEDAR